MSEARFLLATIPPSWNDLYRFGQGRVYKTDKYKKWVEGVGYVLNRQKAGQPTFDQPVHVTVAIARPGKTRDLDNCQKAIGDILEDLGIIANDHLIHGWNIHWSDALSVENGVAVEIIIASVGCRKTAS